MNSQLQTAIEHIHSQFPEYKIYLFGSQARGDNRVDSDIDICAVIPKLEKDPFETAYELRIELKKFLTSPLDIVVVTAEDFRTRQSLFGTLEYTIATEGMAV